MSFPNCLLYNFIRKVVTNIMNSIAIPSFLISVSVAKKQTAKSESISKFKSKGAEIISEGFRIIEQGDIILFDGKTSLILSQRN